ncbi:MAG: response regulator, partial [Kiritimatiellia bacterium]|nr:response regulator [Kiritimatiellia bacterium]
MARILLVDDEPSIRTTLGAFLREAGHAVALAEDVGPAKALMEREVFDMLISDILLPGGSGVDLARVFRVETPSARVIMMTGRPTIETATEGVRVGIADYLTKPVSKKAILRSVGHCLTVKALDDDRLRLEQENRRHRDELEARVAKRTRELEQALSDLKAAQAQMIRQERLRALGQMVSGIAHDFNNILMPILGLSDYLLNMTDDALHEDTRTAVETIESAALDARQIILRLREFYRPEEEPKLAPVQLAEVVREAIKLTEPAWKVQAEAEGRRNTIEEHLPAVPPVLANESQLREVLTNLILNAVDAMPDGGTLNVSLSETDNEVSVAVCDTGVGMPEDVRIRCLDPFFSTKGKRGTGLGLSMCHGIVQRHRGTMTIKSEMGKGTTVIIALPVACHLEQLGKEPPPVDLPTSLRVLLVDDEEWARDLVALFLDTMGYEVKMASSGIEGITCMERSPFDLIITDRAMDGQSGDKVAEYASVHAPDTAVVMLTGFGALMEDE